MNLPIYVKQDELTDVLLNIAPARPVFIWGAPGIGKSALVEQFAEDVGGWHRSMLRTLILRSTT